jgi:hypothetical protein
MKVIRHKTIREAFTGPYTANTFDPWKRSKQGSHHAVNSLIVFTRTQYFMHPEPHESFPSSYILVP